MAQKSGRVREKVDLGVVNAFCKWLGVFWIWSFTLSLTVVGNLQIIIGSVVAKSPFR